MTPLPVTLKKYSKNYASIYPTFMSELENSHRERQRNSLKSLTFSIYNFETLGDKGGHYSLKQNQSLFSDMLTACIIIIPKSHTCPNFGPIMLLNVHIKILANILAIWLN